MNRPVEDIPKKRGRKPQGGRQAGVLVRIPKSELADIDGWRENQADRPTRPEAIRRLVKQGLGPRASADPLHISTKVPPFTVDEDVA